MGFFLVDDTFWEHPKARELSANAIALWTMAGSYCVGRQSGGFLTAVQIRDDLGFGRRDADALVRAGLWIKVQGGYAFHDWGAWTGRPVDNSGHPVDNSDTRRKIERKEPKERQKVSVYGSVSEISNVNHLTLIETRARARVREGVRPVAEAVVGRTMTERELDAVIASAVAGKEVTHAAPYVIAALNKNPDRWRTFANSLRGTPIPDRIGSPVREHAHRWAEDGTCIFPGCMGRREPKT